MMKILAAVLQISTMGVLIALAGPAAAQQAYPHHHPLPAWRK